MSEKLGLLHVSEGEGKERHLVVSKPGASTAAVSQGEVTADASSEAGIVEPGSRPSLDDAAGRVCFSVSLCLPSPVVTVKKNLPSFVHGPQFLFLCLCLLSSPPPFSISPLYHPHHHHRTTPFSVSILLFAGGVLVLVCCQ